MSDASVSMISRHRRITTGHDRLHDRWLRNAAGSAQSALEAAVRTLVRPGDSLLDAGCDTGRFARRLQQTMGPALDITLVDSAREILEDVRDVATGRNRCRLESLPFGDNRFDVVTCAWALETVPRVTGAIGELLRVTRPGGHLCLAFCAQGSNPGLAGRFMHAIVNMQRSASFLNPRDIEFALEKSPAGRVVRLPCVGPAVAMLVTKRNERTRH